MEKVKLTPEQLKSLLEKHPTEVTISELNEVLSIINLQIKEVSKDLSSCEIHHRFWYVIKLEVPVGTKVTSFKHEWIDIEGSDGIAMPVKSTIELVQLVLNFFIPQTGVKYKHPVHSDDSQYTYEELEALLEAFNESFQELRKQYGNKEAQNG